MSMPTPSAAVKSHFDWQYRLFRYFLEHEPGTTVAASLYRVASLFAQLFALFIPIKIILVLGSGTLPAFVQDGLAPETRDAWIAAMVVVTLVLYIVAIVFEQASNRALARGSERLQQSSPAPARTLSGRNGQVAELYTIACRGYANLVVFALGAVGLLLLSPIIFLTMAAIMFIQMEIILFISARGAGWFGRIGSAIVRHPADHLKYLAQINFLCVFALLLLEYLLTGGLETVSAILVLLLARRMFQSIGQFATQAVKLEQAQLGPDSGSTKID